VLGQSVLLDRGPSSPSELTYEERQTRLETAGGSRHIRSLGPYAPRKLSFAIHFTSDEEYEQVRDALFVALRGGSQPCFLLPETEIDPALAIYGELTGTVSFRRDHNGAPLRQAQITIDEGAGFQIL